MSGARTDETNETPAATARQKVRLTLSPQAEKYVRRDAPVGVRRMAAGGALPLEPVELATVLFALVHDPDDEVKSTASESLEALPEGVAMTVLGAEAHPALLSWLAHAWKDDGSRMEKLALNPAVDDRTVALLAGLPHRSVVEIVANNQQRMLRCPAIVDALGDNPLTGRATIDRILSFLGLDRPSAEVAEEPEEASPEAEEITDEEAARTLTLLLGDDASEFSNELIEESEEEFEEGDEKNLFAMIQKMNVMQKIKLARMGNKEARGLLVRDRNKLVATAAIRSPKMTENEVENLAKMRAVSDEILRIIANNREWTRNYQVKMGLATNPKCPVPTAMKFLNFLQERDLRSIMKSKDVATPISTHARRLLHKKGKI
ncbi:MAG: hypothetical protein CL910_10415 [Deltaproteobacteria bacterium]|jgi:hypothetical protein|nr:hypothetical protein [Deltaproteobacteria bacterium]